MIVVQVTSGLTVLLLAAFVAVSVYYFRRQAQALEEVSRVEFMRFMTQRTIWREELIGAMKDLDPLEWLAEVARGVLGRPVRMLRVSRRLADPPLVELLAEGGRRVLFTPLDPGELKRALGRPDGRGRDARARIHRLAADAPPAGWRLEEAAVGMRSVASDPIFDVKAEKAGEALGVPWGPTPCLWIYVLDDRRRTADDRRRTVDGGREGRANGRPSREGA